MRIHVKKHLSKCIVLGLLLISQWTFGQDFEKVQIETVKITENVYMLIGSGGNIGVSVGEDGVLLIDTQFPQLVEKIKAAVAKLTNSPIRFVLNTNWHFDHADGNELLANAGAIIIAHENSRKHMLSEFFLPEYDPDLRIPPYPKAALPVVTLTDSLTLYINDDEIHAFHLPNAHSDGDLAFHFRKANVIHTGDLYFSNGFPFINISSGGSINGMIQAADRMIGIIDANTKVIPGHGPLSNRAEMQEYRDMLVTVRDRIARLVKKGKTLEEVLQTKPTADYYQDRESFLPPDLFVKVVYMDLAEQ